MKKLGVYLLSYKRPQFIHEAIQSILAQTYVDFDLLISENSPDDQVWNEIQVYANDSRVQLIKRTPSLPSLQHFNTLLNECQRYEYVMLFHDDDTLKPEALKKMMLEIEKYPQASAISCNAFITNNLQQTENYFNPYLTKKAVIASSKVLINRYIFKRLSHTPFPSYIYRTEYLKQLSLSPQDGGKYSDTALLIKIVKQGQFIWLAEPLMYYRQHSSNDSVHLNLKDIFSLGLFFLKSAPSMIFQIIFFIIKQIGKKIQLDLKK